MLKLFMKIIHNQEVDGFLFITNRFYIVQRLFNHSYSESVAEIISKLLMVDSETVRNWLI